MMALRDSYYAAVSSRTQLQYFTANHPYRQQNDLRMWEEVSPDKEILAMISKAS